MRRVYEIAKDLGVTSRDIIAALAGLGVIAKSHSSTVEEPVFEKLKAAADKGTLKQLSGAPAARPQRPTRPPRPSAERTAGERPAERPSAERPPAEKPAAQPAATRQPPAAQRSAAARPVAQRPGAERAPQPKPARPAAAAESTPAAPAAVAVAEPEPPVEAKPLTVHRGITVQEFAAKIGKTAAEVVKRLIALGEFKTVAQSMSDDEVELVAGEYGYAAKVVSPDDEPEEDEILEEDPALLVARPPVITVMGHVDHGKTLLLDKIREANVVAQEHGGITQHIGAYQVQKSGRAITFIDTPGHEAFTQMRARGASVTDIAVLVVAADDGVKPQTVEALSHAKAAKVPIVVAVNKIDKPEADPGRVRQQLTEYELVPEEWGGDTPFVDVSAKTGDHITDLLDVLLLVADILELKANASAAARGAVIEAHLDKGRGPVATVLVQRGTLRAGDIVVSGTTYARVRAMLDDAGEPLKEAPPGSPAQVLGFNAVPEAGDDFKAVKDDRSARQLAHGRESKRRSAELVSSRKRVTLEDIADQAEEGEAVELNVVLKADVVGSLEAIVDALERLKVADATVRVLHRAVGAITENDVTLAQASGAVVIGFNVRPDPKARALAEQTGVDIRTYQIIYNLIEEVEQALKGMLKPVFKEAVLGRATVRQVFQGSRIGTVAGSYVDDGQAVRGAKVRVLRDGVIIADTTVATLKRFQDDVRDVASGYECGIGLEGYQDVKEGDALEFYEIREVARI
ncbi:MAG: translation initiation factor IF-2 [Actinomycetota bacterium]